jgi:hypothetical protein
MNIFQKVCVISTFATGAMALATAQTTTPSFPVPLNSLTVTTPMIGISTGQIARLNVLNPGVPAPAATASLCPVQLSFVDSGGNVLKLMEFLVIPGQSQSLDLNHDTEGGTTNAGVRFELRAIIRIPPPSTTTTSFTTTTTPTMAPLIPASCVVPSLEIFDGTTGRTEALVTQTFTLPPSIVTTPGTVTP